MYNRIKEIMLALIFICVLNILPLSSSRIVKAQTSFNKVKTIEEAQEMALNFVNAVVEGDVQNNTWNENTSIDNCFRLYDLEGEVTAYCVQLNDIRSKESGYVIIGANVDTPPIVEYSTSGKFCVDNDDVCYYFGGNDYYIKNDDKEEYINVSTEDRNILTKKEAKEYESNVEYDYSLEWKECEEADVLKCEQTNFIEHKETKNSNPPKTSDPILNPLLYEKGWSSLAPIDVNKYYNYYFSTLDFQGYSAHCAPTAATNLIRYWFLRNNNKYAPLIRDYQWWQVFGVMYQYMKTTSEGTSENGIYKGLKTYLEKFGLDSSGVKYYPTPHFYDVVNEIDNGKGGRPFLYCVYNHKRYGDHCMLALGYMEFEYGDSDFYSRYIRVADGWDNYPDRFVHFTVGQSASSRGIITFKPKM